MLQKTQHSSAFDAFLFALLQEDVVAAIAAAG